MDFRAAQRSIPVGIAASAVAIALVTVAIYALREVMPVAGAGVLYLLPVLLASTSWGLSLGVATSLLERRSRSTSFTSRRPGASRSPTRRTGSRSPSSWSSPSSPPALADAARAAPRRPIAAGARPT